MKWRRERMERECERETEGRGEIKWRRENGEER